MDLFIIDIYVMSVYARCKLLFSMLDAGVWSQPANPIQWNAYYAYGQGYDAYAYGATQDPSLYAYGAYAGYAHLQLSWVKIPGDKIKFTILPSKSKDYLSPNVVGGPLDKINLVNKKANMLILILDMINFLMLLVLNSLLLGAKYSLILHHLIVSLLL
uniref:Uncharacterized protein LOC104236104 n=1 Tax=Nicotiana sylvestris TaxID=4096 RepID=A0A1U7XMY2_NICSY|nr:PREDICTED: uncharacterized protein LOC104236104 [Nicotiana sylvestris]